MKITDIAEMAGVSPATVSRIINHSGYVSKENEKKVMRIIKETNYTPSSIGRNLRKSSTNILLAQFPDLSNSFFSNVIDGMEKKAAEYNYGLLVVRAHNEETEARYLSMLTNRSVDGYISFTSYCGAEKMNKICSRFPVVQAGESDETIRTPIVRSDARAMAYDAVRFLLKKGHRRIAYLYNLDAVVSSPLREIGYKQALEENQIPFDPALSTGCVHSHADAYRACHGTMQVDAPPTAFFCTSDEMASGVIRCLTDLGHRVGEDVDVIGCDNTSLAENYIPSITSVSVPSEEIGSVAVELMMERIKDSGCVNKTIILPHELVIRKSAHL
ncbi:LacI family transcriptional regulator [Eubacteriales bacterium OttesenSCG-928-N13]|nr:LacI family transcriptional regulator [Eubacteriales bacterium OttesenSCG-928-N13]